MKRGCAQSYLFVYGTLRPQATIACAEAREILSKIAPHCAHVGEAHTRGRLYWISWYPALVDSMRVRDRVVGDLMAIARPDKVFPVLDAYENASTMVSPRYEYIRRRKLVVLANGSVVGAWAYVHNRPSAVGARIMGGDFLESVGATLVVAPGPRAFRRAFPHIPARGPEGPRSKGATTRVAPTLPRTR
jgi:gamma-glutamylcyclotransferase (GGCT)/AIG2-like uncharacterized protein YtfP